MSDILIIATGEYPVTEQQFRARYPLISLPTILLEKTLREYGATYVHPMPVPVIDSTIQRVKEGHPVLAKSELEAGGVGYYVQNWIVEGLTEEEIAAVRREALKELDAELAARASATLDRLAEEELGVSTFLEAMTYTDSTIDQWRGLARRLLYHRDRLRQWRESTLAQVSQRSGALPTAATLWLNTPLYIVTSATSPHP